MRIAHERDESLHEFSRMNKRKTSPQRKHNRTVDSFQINFPKIESDEPKSEFPDLRKVLKKGKVEILKKNFISKMRLNSIYREPVDDLDEFTSKNTEEKKYYDIILDKLEETPGLSLGNIALTIWSFINIIQIAMMLFIFSVMLTFEETRNLQIFFPFRIFSLILYLIDMVLNFTTERFEYGKELKNLRKISTYYVKNGFFIDLSSIVLSAVDVFAGTDIEFVLVVMALIKLGSNIKKFQKYEYIYITSSEKEQYYGLIKVILTNFAIGHFLSIFLNLMSSLDQSSNWYYKINIQNSPWFVKYIWGYYWGTNIMLTVGFGDLAANNYYEAIILVFIETFSCITLAYNISYVGAVIGSIRQKDQERKKKLKYFHQMCEENEIPSDLETKITNFIGESYEIQENFEFDEHDAVIESLPKDMQKEYRKEANKILFDGVGFLSYLSKKSMLKMAELVDRKICHPEQIILRKGDKAQFMILQKGILGFTCRTTSTHSSLNNKNIEELKVEKNEKPKIISLDFIKGKTVQYDLKSQKYSILYILSLQNFKESLKGYEIDYQWFCMLRDRDNYVLDEQNIYLCSICKNQYHNKFQCPKLHFIPLKQMVIYSFLHKTKNQKTQRQYIVRKKAFQKKTGSLGLKQIVKKQHQKFIFQHFNEDQLLEIERILNFEKRKNIFKENRKQFKNNMSLKYEEEKVLNKIENLLNRKEVETKFWDIQVDEVFNFRYYFEKDNAKHFSSMNKYISKKKDPRKSFMHI